MVLLIVFIISWLLAGYISLGYLATYFYRKFPMLGDWETEVQHWLIYELLGGWCALLTTLIHSKYRSYGWNNPFGKAPKR